MGYNLFTLPFTLGLIFILGYFFVRSFIWLYRLNGNEKILILKGIPSLASLRAFREVIMESLLHRKIFKINTRLGYMHMSLAFGWFILILGGNIEAFIYRPGTIHPPYYPIFFKFFEPVAEFTGSSWFAFVMDSILLFVLSGVFLAFYKRIRSRKLGLKKSSNLLWNDKIALYSLWAIFPLRLIAESVTSGISGNGGYLTGSLGYIFSSFLPLASYEHPAWWLYSIALGSFFFALPFSRYMHIPTEIVLIFLRNYGIKTNEKYSSFTDIEVYSCSRCGICLDPCPMSATEINSIQSVYLIRDIRNGFLKQEKVQNCLMCGICSEVCPVGIDISALRRVKRESLNKNIPNIFEPVTFKTPVKANVAYFAGCVGQLTPSVTKAMEQIMESAGEKFIYLDKNESICCGRPLKLSGRIADSKRLVQLNSEMILSSGAKLLVTSCPICYKTFKEDYELGIKVMHHSEYLKELLENGRISVSESEEVMVYHDPCELGRGSGIYDQPRELLKYIGNLVEPELMKDRSICCGGSLGNTVIKNEDRRKITRFALENLTKNNPDKLITSCPVCKKTFAQEAKLPVFDIAEIISSKLIKENKHSYMMEANLIHTAKSPL